MHYFECTCDWNLRPTVLISFNLVFKSDKISYRLSTNFEISCYVVYNEIKEFDFSRNMSIKFKSKYVEICNKIHGNRVPCGCIRRSYFASLVVFFIANSRNAIYEFVLKKHDTNERFKFCDLWNKCKSYLKSIKKKNLPR